MNNDLLTYKKVLLIDDDFTIRFVLKKLFSTYVHSPVKIYTSNNGVEGLGYAFLTKPDLIILDSTLPKYGGLELIEYLRTNTRLKNSSIPIIVLHEGGNMPNLPFNYFVIKKTDAKFVPRLLTVVQDKLGLQTLPEELEVRSTAEPLGIMSVLRMIRAAIHRPYLAIVKWLGSIIVKLANVCDRLMHATSHMNFIGRDIIYVIWAAVQIFMSVAFTLFHLISGHSSEENLQQSRADERRFRVHYYPTLATLVSGVFMTVFQFVLFVLGGLVIFNTKVNSVFALGNTAVIVDLGSSYFNHDEVKFINDQLQLRPQSVINETETSNSHQRILGTTASNLYTRNNTNILFDQPIDFTTVDSILEESSLNSFDSSILNPDRQITADDLKLRLFPANVITYQLSPNKIDWFYYSDQDKWQHTDLGFVRSNTIQELNQFLNKYPTQVGGSQMYIKAFLHSDGNSFIALQKLQVNRKLELIAPIYPTPLE